MNRKRILVLNDGSSYENWGIKACIDGVRSIISHHDNGFYVDRLSHQFMHKRYSFDFKILGRNLFLDDGRVAKKLFKPFHMLPRIADEYDAIANIWLSGKGGAGVEEYLDKVKKADIVLFNAEGSTYRDNIGAIKGLFMLWFAKTKLNKKCYFINGSVTLTLVDSILPAMVRKTFDSIDMAVVREPYSYSNIIDYYPSLKNKVKVRPDSVFSLPDEYPVSDRLKSLPFWGEDFFCVSLSMLPMDIKYSKKESTLVRLIEDIKALIPNVVFLAKDIEDQRLKSLANVTEAYFLSGDFSYKDVQMVLSRSKLLLSGRYHHLIFAVKVGCPIVPFGSSSHKIHGLSEFYKDICDGPFDPTDLTYVHKSILSSVKKILDHSPSLYYKSRSKELKEMSLDQGFLFS